MTSALTLNTFASQQGDSASLDRVFVIEGDAVRLHRGRGVVRVLVDGTTHFLKRYWFMPTRPFKRNVALGFHELRMIDWLPANGFTGPSVVARGRSGRLSIRPRMFFLMEEIPGETPLEEAWLRNAKDRDSLVSELASFAARLHDAGFVHTDFSQRHILVGRDADHYTFRLIDLERASVGHHSEPKAAADLKTLAASVQDLELRRILDSDMIDEYVARRRTLSPSVDFRALLSQAQSTRTFLRQSRLTDRPKRAPQAAELKG